MPSTNGIGHSDDTPRKEVIYSWLLSWHFNVTQSVLRKNRRYQQTYHLIDTTAGCGTIPGTDEDASPLVAARMLTAQERPYTAHFIELERDNKLLLEEHLADFSGNTALYPVHGDTLAHVPALCARFGPGAFGLIYHDTTGTSRLGIACRRE